MGFTDSISTFKGNPKIGPFFIPFELFNKVKATQTIE
jgi:hypothetical protein